MIRAKLLNGAVIPAHPLALTSARKFDEKHQRALTRYYLAAWVGELAVGVHTTQFATRDPSIGLYKPVLELAREEIKDRDVLSIAGVCGPIDPALAEARLALHLGYQAVLLSPGGLGSLTDDELLDRARAVAEIIPVIGFYLQPSAGGRNLRIDFWRKFAEIKNVVAVKIACFNRYQTLDVIRAVVESGREKDIALYTGNDDNIIADLCTTWKIGDATVQMAGGLLGHWAVWTHTTVQVFESLRLTRGKATIASEWLTLGQEITDMDAAIFDPANAFHGCISGVNEVLARQGLMAGRWCLDENEQLSPGQGEEITRVSQAYPHLTGEDFILQHRDEWLS